MTGKLAEAFVEIGTDLTPFDMSLNTVKGKLAGLAATRFNIPGGGFAALLGGAAMMTGINRAISGASDLAETVSKVGLAFGEQAGKVTAASDDMAAAFGIPKREFLDAASMFGLMATGMGQTKTEAADLSVKLAKLAIDASSLYNVPVADALEKIRAGLTGESEPLKAINVFMDEASTKQEAFRLGLSKTNRELTNQEKFLARASLIEKGLLVATGDLARTQDGAANQTRKFWGMLQNLGDTVGTTLLPAFGSFIRLANEIGTDLSKSAASGSGAWTTFTETIRGFFDTVGVLYRNWSDIAERTGVMVGGSIQNVGEYFAHLGSTIQSFLDWFATNWPKIISDTVDSSMKVFANFAELFTDPQKMMGKIIAGGFSGQNVTAGSLLTDGVKTTTPAFKAPALKMSSVDDQIKAIDERMAQREGEKAAKAAGVAAKVEAAKAAGGWGDQQSSGQKTLTGVTDAESYRRSAQDSILAGNRGDTQTKILTESQKQVAELKSIKESIVKQGKGAVAAVFG